VHGLVIVEMFNSIHLLISIYSRVVHISMQKINFTLETKAPVKFVTLVSSNILVKFHATTLGIKPCSSMVYLFHSVDIAKTF